MAALTFNNDSTVIVFDGHSQVVGALVAQNDRVGDQLMRLPPINGNMTYQMLGQNGATYRSMIEGPSSGASEVLAAYQPGKQNFLFVWEAHNTAATPRPNGALCTVDDLLSDCREYLAAVKSTGQKWRIFLILECAFMDSTVPSHDNDVMDQYNAYVRSNWTDLGVEGYIETRPPGGPLAYTPPYTYTDINGSEGRWIKSGYYADYTHFNAAGYAVIAQYIADKLMTLTDSGSQTPGVPSVLQPGLLRGPNGRLLLAGGRPLSIGDTSTSTPIPSTGTLTLTLKDLYVGNTIAHPIIQRKAGTDFGDVPVMFSYTGGAPGAIQARVVNTDNQTVVIKDWTALTGVTVNDTALTGLGYLPNVPIGCDYQLQIRDGSQPANAPTISNGSRRWGVGVCVLIAGQSNMIGTISSGEFNAPIPGTNLNEANYWQQPNCPIVFFGQDGPVVAWTAGGVGGGYVVPGYDSGGGGATCFMRMISDGLTAKYGRRIPVCGALWAFGATGLSDMYPPGANNKAAIFTNSGTTNGTIGWLSPPGYNPGDFEGIVLHQGEAEAGFISRADRLGQLKAYYNFMLSLVAPHGRTAADLFFLPAVLGSYANAGNTENIRAAVYDLEVYAQANGWPRVKAGWNCIDLDAADPTDQNSDGLHFHDIPGGNQHRRRGLRRVIQAVLKAADAVPFGGMGARITGVTRSGNVATVTISHDGGTALVARNPSAALTGWYANTAADFGSADIAVTATIASANTVAVTFPNGTAFPAYLKYAGGKVGTLQSQHPNVTNPVLDDTVYPTGAHPGDQVAGMPLQPTVDSRKVD